MIIDGHAHIFTASIAKSLGIGKIPQIKDMVKYTVDDHTKVWLEEMDKLKIDKTVFMANASLNKDFIDFIHSSNRFIGMAKINPLLKNSLSTLKKEFRAGMKGVKFYATNDRFDVGSKKAYPFYKYCEENNIPIVIHFGVSIGWAQDLMAGNPLRLSMVLRDFPKLNFIIAHFGAGFFREVLMLRYKTDNLYVDTSGTNNWLSNQDNFLTLKDVFAKTIDVFTPQRIIFGSDTRIFPDGYRKHILEEQENILNELKLKDKDKEDIMHNNAKRVFNL